MLTGMNATPWVQTGLATGVLALAAGLCAAQVPTKADTFFRDSDAFARRTVAPVAFVYAKIQPIDWNETLLNGSLASLAKIKKSSAVVKENLRLSVLVKNMVEDNRRAIEKYIRDYGLAPTDFQAEYSSFQRALNRKVGYTDEVLNARIELYRRTLDVLAFAERTHGRITSRNGRYELSQPAEQEEFYRLMGSMRTASEREGVAVASFNTQADTEKATLK